MRKEISFYLLIFIVLSGCNKSEIQNCKSEKKLILSFEFIDIFPTGIPGLNKPPSPDV